ncbi:hypothetical protein, partial [Roseibium sp.]|uniref:hypothetical protein n=1 Tax=Roseibium sp. TaxID=1936156 RepID=UPI003264FBD7
EAGQKLCGTLQERQTPNAERQKTTNPDNENKSKDRTEKDPGLSHVQKTKQNKAPFRIASGRDTQVVLIQRAKGRGGKQEKRLQALKSIANKGMPARPGALSRFPGGLGAGYLPIQPPSTVMTVPCM